MHEIFPELKHTGKKRVLHISQSASGGVETYLLHLFQYLDRGKYDTFLICPTDGTLAKNVRRLSAEVYTVELVREINPLKDLAGLFKIYRFIKENHFDIIHTHSSKAGFIGRLAAKLAGHKAVLFTPHAFFYLRFKGIKRKFFLYLEKIARTWTGHLIATSDSEAFRAIHDVKFPTHKVSTIYNAIDMKLTTTPSSRTKNNQAKVLFAGRLDYQKNPEMFIRVSSIVHKKAPWVKYLMLGFGGWYSLGNRIKNMVERYNLTESYRLIAWLPRAKALKIISECTLLVVTSRYEGLSYVPIEAMALCKPVVATNVDGLKDVILHEKTGYCVDVDDNEKMAKHILRLLKDKDLCKKMGQAGRQRVKETFNIEENIKQLETVYDNLTHVSK